MSNDRINLLALSVFTGDDVAFKKLEGFMKPLLVSTSNNFATYHPKLEYDDFYSICLAGLYDACTTYDHNEDFSCYAKKVIVNKCNDELRYWNANNRLIFDDIEIPRDELFEKGIELHQEKKSVEEIVLRNEFFNDIKRIIKDSFNKENSEVLMLYLFENLTKDVIAREKKMKYKKVDSIIRRGVVKIRSNYRRVDNNLIL